MNRAEGPDRGENAGAELPFVDEQSIDIDAPRAIVWRALRRHVATSLRVDRSPLAWVLGTQPAAGFEVSELRPGDRLALVGRHRFSRYELTFDLSDADHGATNLTARTRAAFPGLHGRVYRALVIGTGGHAAATRHILRAVGRLARDAAPADPAG